MRDIDYYVTESKKMDLATFAKTYPAPVLLYRGVSQSASSQEEDQSFKTQLLRLDLLRSQASDAAEVESVRLNTVFQALKRPGGLYPDRISRWCSELGSTVWDRQIVFGQVVGEAP